MILVGLVLAILLGTYGRNTRLLNRLEWWTEDLRMALVASKQVPIYPKIAIAEIDENTLAHTKRRSPIDRDFLARLFAKLDDAKPAAIAVDILFDRATEPAEDEALRQQLHAMTVPVLLAYGSAELDPAEITPEETAFLDKFIDGIDNKLVRRAHVKLPPDEDNVVRSAPATTLDDTDIPSLSAGAVAATGWPWIPASGRIAYYGYYDKQFEKLVSGTSVSLNSDRFAKPVAYAIAAASGPGWEKLFKPLLAGRIVFVGNYIIDNDEHDTPFTVATHSPTSGVIIQATLAAQMIDGRWIRTPGSLELGVISLLMVMAGFLLGVRSNSNWTTLGGLGGVLVVIWAMGVAAYAYPVDGGMGRSMYPLVSPSIAMMIAAALGQALTRRQFAAQRNFIQGALATYVSASVARQLMEDPTLLSVGGDRREISALFTDIEGFTTLSEELDPATLVDILNRYLEGMTGIVLAHDGMLDKYIGDALVALWNADVPRPDHAAKAVDCAVELSKFAADFAEAERARGLEFGRTRIGVQTGQAVVGNYGGARKLNFTAIGDTMNLTSRLEGANKYLGTQILVGEAAALRSGRRDLRPVCDLVVKGKDEAVSVYEPVPEWSADLLERYRHAYALLRDADPGAHAAFQALADTPDPIIHLFLTRIAAGRAGVRVVLDEK
jgi:adenylate cyclase